MSVAPGLLVHGGAQVFVAQVDAADKPHLTIADQELTVIAEVDLEAPAPDVTVTKRGNAGAGGREFIQPFAGQKRAANIVVEEPDLHALGQLAFKDGLDALADAV